jgi:hypothetical protein
MVENTRCRGTQRNQEKKTHYDSLSSETGPPVNHDVVSKPFFLLYDVKLAAED